MGREEELRARPVHEAEFRATWKLREGVAKDPFWVSAYEWAATHRLALTEMGQLGPHLVRREGGAAGLPERAEAPGPAELIDRARKLAADLGEKLAARGSLYESPKSETQRVAKLGLELIAARGQLAELKAEWRRFLLAGHPPENARHMAAMLAADYPLLAAALLDG